MKASALINILTYLIGELGDMDVLIQSDGCCYHAHKIRSVEKGLNNYKSVKTEDELNKIIIRSDA